MKHIIIVSLLFLISRFAFSQSENIVVQNDTSSYIYDTVSWTGNMIGLNVYPAFGVIGGSVMPASKIFFQYRHMWNNTNLRISANYINYYADNDKLDVVSVSDTSMQLRKYSNNYYTFDLRCGIEHAYHVSKFRFYYGAGLIGGYHNYGKDYYMYERNFLDNPNLEASSFYDEKIEEGWYRADMLKLGVDFTLGVDIKMSDNVLMSIQYAPELAYNKFMSSEREDPSGVFVGDVDDYWDFRGDFIDIVLSIVF